MEKEKEKFQIQKSEEEIKEEIREILKLSPFFEKMTQDEFEKAVNEVYERDYKGEKDEKLAA